MPATSAKQKKFMDAAAHNPAFAKKAGIPVKVAKEFSKASKGQTFKGDKMKESKSMTRKEVSFMKAKGAPKSMIKHEMAEEGETKNYRFGGALRKMKSFMRDKVAPAVKKAAASPAAQKAAASPTGQRLKNFGGALGKFAQKNIAPAVKAAASQTSTRTASAPKPTASLRDGIKKMGNFARNTVAPAVKAAAASPMAQKAAASPTGQSMKRFGRGIGRIAEKAIAPAVRSATSMAKSAAPKVMGGAASKMGPQQGRAASMGAATRSAPAMGGMAAGVANVLNKKMQPALRGMAAGGNVTKMGSVKTAKPSSGSASRRADGIAQKGKTKGKMLQKGGKC